MGEKFTPQHRILTGMRPSGDLHLGHYAGALKEWVDFDKNPDYQCIFLLADYHALGDYSHDVARITRSVRSVALDWMAVGLDPEKSWFSIQSGIPEHAELTIFLANLMKKSELDRNPTLKSEMATLGNDKVTLGFYNYPALQVGDILLPKADLVPVGDDQIPHIEFTRKVARRFNATYGGGRDVFPQPNYHLSDTPRLVGTDGDAKMSKSRGNTIHLSDNERTVTKKVMGMYTDPTRLRATDPGKVEGNPVFIYHDVFNPNTEEVEDMKRLYAAGRIGDVDVKKRLAAALNAFLEPIRDRRSEIEQHPEIIDEALRYGTEMERNLAQETMEEVRQAMGLKYY